MKQKPRISFRRIRGIPKSTSLATSIDEQSDLPAAASACVKMQYLEKLLQEAEQVESELMDH